VRDISAEGVGLRLECRLRERAVLTVELLGKTSARTLLASVVHAVPQGRGWLHGCRLTSRLTAEELQDWVG
jgi:hypothetical protein